MRILLVTHSFNSLSQRLYAELARRGHQVAVELDIADSVTREAVALFRPEVLVAPFLKRALPADVHDALPCLIVHPGVAGDRGAFALDWAILRGESRWGVTVLQATAELDGGPIWAEAGFPMRAARKSSLYRFELTDAAVAAVLRALEGLAAGAAPVAQAAWPGLRGAPHPRLDRAARRIDWAADDTGAVLRRIRAADGAPGVVERLAGIDCRLYDAHPVDATAGGAAWDALRAGVAPGTAFARRGDALAVATRDGAVWIGHARRLAGEGAPDDTDFKLPAAQALGDAVAALPRFESGEQPCDELRYREADGVGWLEFEFHNGAMSTAQCQRLAAAVSAARARPTRVLVLAGGAEFFSNGLHLNLIEAAASPADASMDNIEAIDEVARAVLEADDRLTVAALRGNAGAGGVFLALAADRVWARPGVVLNPHYRNMGNLYGSEYWTYSLPRRVGAEGARRIMDQRLPLLAEDAAASGLIDEVLQGPQPADPASAAAVAALASDPAQADATGRAFVAAVAARAWALAHADDLAARLAAKRARRAHDEAQRPLAAYRADELARMRRNFYGFDPSYHVARSNFVRKVPHAWTPRHLAPHREPRAGARGPAAAPAARRSA